MAYNLWTRFGNSCSQLIFVPKLLTDLEVIGCRFQTGNFLTVASRVSQTQRCSTQQIQLKLVSLKYDISDKNALCDYVQKQSNTTHHITTCSLLSVHCGIYDKQFYIVHMCMVSTQMMGLCQDHVTCLTCMYITLCTVKVIR